jgi:hypothetical protein
MHPHAHAHAHHDIAPRVAARACKQASGAALLDAHLQPGVEHDTRDAIRVQASGNANDGDPHPQTPALGLGFELNPAIYEDADGGSEPNSGNPSSAPLSVTNSMSRSFSGFCMGSSITIPSTNMTLKPYLCNMNGELDLYTPFMEDETMFMFSPQGFSGASDDADESYFPFTPVTPTIPLPMTALAGIPLRTDHSGLSFSPSAA